jgi:hypothetical protein
MAYDFRKPPLPSYMDTSREGLINSGFHSEICSWAAHQGEFSGHPLVRQSLRGVPPPSDGCSQPPEARSLRPRQEPPSRHVQICQSPADLEPVGILRQPTVPHVGPAEDPLDHQERMLYFGPYFRFRSVPGSLLLTQWLMTMGFRLNEALRMRRVVPDHVTLSAVGGITPYAGLLTM